MLSIVFVEFFGDDFCSLFQFQFSPFFLRDNLDWELDFPASVLVTADVNL